MANEFNENLDIDIQTNGIEQAIKQFNNLSLSISKLTMQIDKLSNSLGRMMNAISNVSSATNFGNRKSILKNSAYSKGYLELAKQGYLGDLGTFLLINPSEIKKAVLKQQKNLDLPYLMAGGSSTQSIDKFYDIYGGRTFTFPQISANLDTTVIDYYNRLSNNINNTSQSFRNAAVASRTFSNELRNTDKHSKSASDRLWNLSKRIASLTRIYYTATRLARVISQVVKESGSWIENLNLFAVTFGESNYREMLDWATDYADKLGMANNEIVRMTGYFKQLSSAIGITNEQGDQFSQILTQLGYDFASFYNIDTASAFEKLQSGIFSGQIRTLRSLGIDVSQAAVQNLLDMNKAFAGLNASATQMTQTQKVLARMILTMQAGVNAFGDMARSIDTLQNRQRVLTASLENLRLALGDALAEPAREFFAYGIAITQVITDIIRSIVPLQTELSYDIGDTVFTEITDEAEEAESAINQLSFDKFNALTTGDDEQVSLTEALNNLLQEQIALYEQVSSQFDGVDERVKEIRDTILQWVFPNKTLEDIQLLLDTSNGMEQFELIMENMNPVLTQIIDGIRSLWTVFQQFLTIVRQVSPELVDILASLFSLLSTIIDILDELNLLKPVLVAIIGLRIANKLKSFGLSFSGITRAITSMTIGLEQARVLQGLTFGERAKATMTNYFNTFKTKTIDGQKVMVQSLNKARVAATALNSVMAAIMAYSIANSFFGQFEREGAIIAGAIGLVVVALMAVAAAAMAAAGAMSWGVAIPIIVGAVAGGVAAIQSIVRGAQEVQGYAIGGIPDKSELFYMNEHGIPEALINTGGTQTNVINQQQLKLLVRDGFIEAMSINGEQQVNVTISGNDINNSAFARAIFPALKAESKRRGGSQL